MLSDVITTDYSKDFSIVNGILLNFLGNEPNFEFGGKAGGSVAGAAPLGQEESEQNGECFRMFATLSYESIVLDKYAQSELFGGTKN